MRSPIKAAAPGPGETEGQREDHQDAGSSSTLAPTADNGTDDALTAQDRAALNGYAVLVEIPGEPSPRLRRRLFLSLHSATRAVSRADDKGLAARLVLVRLEPAEVLL